MISSDLGMKIKILQWKVLITVKDICLMCAGRGLEREGGPKPSELLRICLSTLDHGNVEKS